MEKYKNNNVIVAKENYFPLFDMLKKSKGLLDMVIYSLDYEEKELIGKAMCHPDDEFDNNFGERLAELRLEIAKKEFLDKEWSRVEEQLRHALLLVCQQRIKLQRKIYNLKEENRKAKQ